MAIALHASPRERREWQRFEAEQEVNLVVKASGREQLCQVKDISLGGARLYCGAGLPSGEIVTLNHPSAGEITVEPLWRAGREMGVQFDFSEESLALISQCLSAMLGTNSAQRSLHT